MRDHHALVAYLTEQQGRSAADVVAPCATFAAGAVKAQTGVDPLKRLRQRWKTNLGAERALRRLGGLEKAVDRVLPSIAPAMAKRGDVALAVVAGQPFLTLVEGATLVGLGEGLVRLPRSAMTKAWSADV